MADEVIGGRYRLLEPLGRGAMSAVWLAYDEELGRQVAVKMLAPSADRQRFEREARAAAALSHPNICSLYDYGEAADGRPYMVLEYLANGSLEDRLASGPLPDAETERIATAVAAGLAHAHDRGLVHRDMKPANILFDAEERAKIADFGIARMGGTGTLTEAGTVLGTASYISPEQAAGQPAGPASDVYSFGVILFRMLTGRLPFVSTNAMELVRMHRDDPPPAVHDLRPDAPARLEAVTTASLAKSPADRPRDGAALLAELRGGETTAATVIAPAVAAAAATGADATQVIAAPKGSPRARRSLAPVVIVTLVLLLAGGALALALTSGGGSGGGAPPVSTPGLSLPNVSSARSTTTAPTVSTTTAQSTTQPTTTAPTTTAAHTTTRQTTTHPLPTTIAPPTTTVAPPPTTTAPVTLPTTTDTTPTTTAATTTAATTTTP
ncbi:MAG TPA: serine/threonine-protein kinase [Gaiellaceae bacterium]